MATGISFTMITAPFTEATAGLAKAADKATMKALRSTGRGLQRAAKANAPVYHGTDPRAVAESGNLKKSIRNAKRITQHGFTYELKVGPWGSTRAGSQVIRHGTRGGFAIDSLTAKHLGIEGPSMAAGESTIGQVRGVLLYRGAQELNYGYMHAGIAAATGDVSGIAEETYARAFAAWTR
jgi:hypothetical protein